MWKQRVANRTDTRNSRSRAWILPYVRTIAGVLGITLVREGFEFAFALHGRSPYSLYLPLLVYIALTSGVGPTLVASVLSLIAAWFFFVPPTFTFGYVESRDLAATILYVVTAAALIWLSRRAAATRKTLERALFTARQLAAIVESSDDAIIGTDLDGIIRSWNAGAERMYGYSANEALGNPIAMLIPPSRVREEGNMFAAVRGGRHLDHYESVRLSKTGRRLHVSLSVSPIRDASGAVVGASKIARDITEHRRAERAIAQEREWFRVTLASIADAVITTDQDGAVTYANPMAERLTGWNAGRARGRPLSEVFAIVGETSREPIENPCDQVLRGGNATGVGERVMLIGKFGREHPIEQSAGPIIDDRHRIIGVVLVFRDVSERRERERERQAAEHEREQLLQSERAARGVAERASQAKDEFVATLSHELRTPLNAILAWTHLLRRDQVDAGTLERGLTVMERNTRLQAQLISDLLDVSRIGAGKLQLELQLVELPVVIDQAIETVKASADAKQIAIESKIDPTIEPMSGDPARLQQVVWNLLANAIKFSPKGSRVDVEARRDADEVRISVVDSGDGISAGFLPYLFDRFRQADSSTTRRYGGLGLGLTIVKQLVELHGGSVSAHSAGEGRGATFTVRLPLDGSREELNLEASKQVPAPQAEAARLRGLSVIVVEDEPDARELVERLLSEAGCRVVAVGSAEDALSALERERPDVLVSDIGLPDVDGYSLIRRIRELEHDDGAKLPAIALTAFARSVDRTRALRAGFQAHLAKPVDPAELFATVSSFAEISARHLRTSGAA
jgi:PAS domain S-box-containing protein